MVREVLESLTRDGHLFDGEYDAIEMKGCFPTKYVSEIEAEMLEDDESQFAKTQQILEEVGILDVSPVDCANVAYVCTAVSNRAASICAAGIAGKFFENLAIICLCVFSSIKTNAKALCYCRS